MCPLSRRPVRIVFRVKLVALSVPRSPSSAAQPLSPQMQVDQLPVELLIELLRPLTTNDLARVDQVSHIFHSAPQTAQSAAVGPQPATERPQSVVEQVLRRRAAEGGQAVPEVLGEARWEQLLLWQERRRRWGTQQVVERGAHHWVFVDAGGGVLTCGSESVLGTDSAPWPNAGVLGHGALSGGHKVVALPTVVAGLTGVRVVSIAASDVYSLALTEAGQVFSWGKGENGCLGHGNEQDLHTPKLVEALQAMRVVGVAASAFDSLARTNAGQLFQWGALGGRDARRLLVPKLVTALQAIKVVDVAAGRSLYLAVTDDGRVYSWGRGGSPNALGHGIQPGWLMRPKMIEALEPHEIVSVAAARAGFAISEAGRVFSWGPGYGLGNAASWYSFQLTPKLIEALQEVKVVVVVTDNGGGHTIAVTDDGQVYSWGSGREGALGHGNMLDQCTPKRIEALQGLRVVGALGRARSSMAVTSTGKVYCWGSDLGGEYAPTVLLPQLYPSLQL